jgi:adenine/guanine phosphoribosyltransferase-like PRPP-binding protein
MARKRKSKAVDVEADQVNDLIAVLHGTIKESNVDVFTAVTAIGFFHADSVSQALSVIVEREDLLSQIQEIVKENLLEPAEKLITHVDHTFTN